MVPPYFRPHLDDAPLVVAANGAIPDRSTGARCAFGGQLAGGFPGFPSGLPSQLKATSLAEFEPVLVLVDAKSNLNCCS